VQSAECRVQVQSTSAEYRITKIQVIEVQECRKLQSAELQEVIQSANYRVQSAECRVQSAGTECRRYRSGMQVGLKCKYRYRVQSADKVQVRIQNAGECKCRIQNASAAEYEVQSAVKSAEYRVQGNRVTGLKN
jgi:hypothetical protein